MSKEAIRDKPKERAIEFVEWTYENGYYMLSTDKWKELRNQEPTYTTEQLYTLYLQTK